MVHPGRHIWEVEYNRIVVVDPWKAYVCFTFRFITSFDAPLAIWTCSRIWKDYSLVRVTASPWICSMFMFQLAQL